jgi:hypothetical protein
VQYEAPVDGVVVDGFRPPTSPFGPGNRGIDYATAPGAAVRAAADGVVAFAGSVGGAQHVTVRHADGLRTSYSFVASVTVAVGKPVRRGDVIARSSGHLHFGVRAGATYLDPEALLTGRAQHLRLVATPPDDGGGLVEGRALLATVLEDLSSPRVALLRHYALDLAPTVRVGRVSRAVATWWRGQEECTPKDVVPARPRGRRIAVLVGGLGTTDRASAVDRLDRAALGYAATDVLRFSYRGGRTPRGPAEGSLATIPAHPYGRADTQIDLLVSAERLRALLADVATREPGVPIDVIAHSQGGLVAQLALTDLVGGPAPPAELDLVATLGAPHTGSDAATAAAALRQEPSGDRALDWLASRLHLGFDPDAPSVAQESEVSALMADLATTAPPPGVRLLAVGARGDQVVPAGHTRLWDAPNPIVDLTGADAHTRLPGDPQTTRELGLALAGRSPTCESLVDVLTDRGMAEGISWSQDLIGFAAWRLAARPLGP